MTVKHVNLNIFSATEAQGRMRTIKLTIQFDGTLYHGWQTQSRDRTVQTTIRDSLARMFNKTVVLHGSGRTDAGVHALGQVAHFKIDSNMSLSALQRGLNSLLPGDIVITAAEEADADFNARFSAVSRVYWYCIWNAPAPSPFFTRYAWCLNKPLDLAAMKAAARSLVGEHDFTSFHFRARDEANPVREIKKISLRMMRKSLILVEIEAGSFLRNMVRIIVGTLVQVGRGRLTPDSIEDILNRRDRRCAGPTAPAHGLFLKKIKY
jgi:tRNA pseudouridine38-40 synthase